MDELRDKELFELSLVEKIFFLSREDLPIGKAPLTTDTDRPFLIEPMRSSRLSIGEVIREVIGAAYRFTGIKQVNAPIYRYGINRKPIDVVITDATIISDSYFLSTPTPFFTRGLHTEWVNKGRYLYIPLDGDYEPFLKRKGLLSWDAEGVRRHYLTTPMRREERDEYYYVFTPPLYHPLVDGFLFTGRVSLLKGGPLHEYEDINGEYGALGEKYLHEERPGELYFPLGVPRELIEDTCHSGVPSYGNELFIGRYTGWRTTPSYGGIYYLYEREGIVFLHEAPPREMSWLNAFFNPIFIEETFVGERFIERDIDSCGLYVNLEGISSTPNFFERLWSDCSLIDDNLFVWGRPCYLMFDDWTQINDGATFGDLCKKYERVCPPYYTLSDVTSMSDYYILGGIRP